MLRWRQGADSIFQQLTGQCFMDHSSWSDQLRSAWPGEGTLWTQIIFGLKARVSVMSETIALPSCSLSFSISSWFYITIYCHNPSPSPESKVQSQSQRDLE